MILYEYMHSHIMWTQRHFMFLYTDIHAYVYTHIDIRIIYTWTYCVAIWTDTYINTRYVYI